MKEYQKLIDARPDLNRNYSMGEEKIELTNFSNYFLITIKRQQYNRTTNSVNKLFTKIQIDEKIDIGGSKFDVVGVLVHSGKTANSGHYFYESIKDKHEYNDSTVGPLYSYGGGKDFIEKNWTTVLYQKSDKKTGGRKKTHKLRLKNKNKKSLRQKTRNAINRL